MRRVFTASVLVLILACTGCEGSFSVASPNSQEPPESREEPETSAGPASASAVDEIPYKEVVWPWETDPGLQQGKSEAMKRLARYGTLSYEHWENGEIAFGRRRTRIPEPLRKVVIFRGDPTDDVLVQTLPLLPELRHLYLGLGHVSARGLAAVATLEYLERLQLIGGKPASSDWREAYSPDPARADLTAEALRHLSGHRRLKELSLQAVRVDDAELAELRTLPNLHGFWLNATDVTPKCFQTIATWPKIGWVGVAHQDFNAPIDPATYRAIASLHGRLTTLSFGEWGESRIHPSMIPAIAEIESLEWLDLGDPAHFTAADLAPLKKLANLTHFEPHIPPNDDLGKALQELADAANRRSMEKLRERAPTR